MSTNTTTRVQSVDLALCILETLLNYKFLSLIEISEKVNFHKTTSHCLLNSLLDNAYIENDPISKQYRISLKLLELGNRCVQNIVF